MRKRKFKAQKLQPVLFLLPAAVIMVLVTIMLPFTVPTLKDIPERLSLGPVITEAATNEEKPASVCMNYKDGVYTGSAYGFGGEIRVKVTVKDGYIVTVDILEAPGETEPYFSLARTVMNQVYDSQTWEVDTITGATYSSRGILAAIENAITGRVVETERPEANTPVADTEVFREPSAYKDGTYTGTAQGFGGPVTVQVVIRNGKIVSVEVVSADGETPEYLNRAKSVTDVIVSSGSPNVDTVSGATYSSTGIITATKRALAKAGGEPAPAKEKLPKPKKEKKQKKQKPEKQVDLTGKQFADGVYTGIGEGFGGDVEVSVTIKNGKIERVEILRAENETKEYFAKAEQLTGIIVSKQTAQVDVISGATYSSEGILQAVGEALAKSAKRYEEQNGSTEKPKEPEKPGGSDDPGGSDNPGGAENPGGSDKPGGSDDPGGSDNPGGTDDPGGTEPPLYRYLDGIYTGSARCEDTEGQEFNYLMTVSVTVTDGKIVNITYGVSDDMSEYPEDNTVYINFAVNGRTFRGVVYPGIFAQVLDSQQSDSVDAVSGATYSSNALIQAVKQAVSQAVKPEETEE